MSDNSEILIKKERAPKTPGQMLARFESITDVTESGKDFESEFKSAKRTGLMIVFLVFGVFGVWSMVMPIDGAANAPGRITVKSFKKPLQHLEGGIIKEVLVQDGDTVKAGQVLIVLDDTQAKAQLAVMNTQLKARLAMEARLIAERDNLPAVTYPAELGAGDPESTKEIEAQNQMFKTRKTHLAGDTSVLQQRIEQLQSRIIGYEALRESKTKLAASFQDELKDFQSLLAQGYADKNKLRELERNYQSMTGEAADLTSNIATTKMQIGEMKVETAQLQNKMQAEIAAQLSEVQTQMKDIRDRITAASDTVKRAEIRSQDNGVIYNLKVHAPGTVIPATTILAEIVPQSDNLVIEAQVSPMDIDRVVVGQPASVRLPAFSSRLLPPLEGKLIYLSGDSIVEQNGVSYFLARLELTPDSIAALKKLKLVPVPGMPADVLIKTGSRTLFQYLTKSLSDSLSHAMRED